MASTLPAGLYDDIVSTAGSLVPYNMIYTECNAKSFVGQCRLRGMDCNIRVSSEYTGIKYFLTLTHEIAHAITWSKYGFDKNIKPHGTEWKDEYRSPALDIDQKWPYMCLILGFGLMTLRLAQVYYRWLKYGEPILEPRESEEDLPHA